MTTGVFKYSLLTSVVLVAAVFGAWYFLSPPEGEPAMPGRIEGTTSYPSEYLPSQTVCAEPVGGGDTVCTDAGGGYAGELQPPWSIELPAGRYYIYAQLADPSEMGSDFGDYRAYYSEYVRCGMEASCSDHGKVEVVVVSGQTTQDIMPYDWYAR